MRAWILAARPKTLTASAIPVIVGTVLSRMSIMAINWRLAGYVLLTALLIQIGINLVNDALDFENGKDTKERLGPKRATHQGWLSVKQVKKGSIICFSLALLCSIPLVLVGGLVILSLICTCVILGYFYTGGPYPLACHGLGDLFVIIFFGWVATGISYYLQTGIFDELPLLAGTIIGMLCTVIIAVNNLRDISEDKKTNKKTLAVLFGKTFVRVEITFLILGAFFMNLLWLQYGYYFAAILPLCMLPLGTILIRFIWNTEPSPIYNGYLAFAALLHLLFGLLLAFGLYIQ